MAKTESAQILEAYQEVVAASAKGQQALLATDQGSLYHDVMQESYKTLLSMAPPLQLPPGFPIQKSELLARLEQGRQDWTPEGQNSNQDAAEENPVKLPLTGWHDPGTWWNSYRSPINVRSSDSSSSDNESSSEKEEEKNVKQECLRITKPRAALLGKREGNQEGCEPWQSEQLAQPPGSMRMPLCWTREKDRGLVKSKRGRRGADPGKKLFVCPQCGNAFNRKSSLSRHLANIHDAAKPCEWPPRRKNFLEKPNSGTRGKRHMKTSRPGREPYECPECGESFLTKASFAQHRKSHASATTFQCPACDRNYIKGRYLVKHLTKAHLGAHLYNCPDCGKGFLGEEDLSVHHERIHEGGSFHQCGKSCQEKLSFIRHQTQQAKEASWQCPHCEMSFANSRSLAIHLRLHKNQKPPQYLDEGDSAAEDCAHVCPDCGKCFKGEKRFLNHQRVHREEQQSLLSEKGDVLKGGAQNHKIHAERQCGAESAGGKPLGLSQPVVKTEETLYSCPDCGKIFRDSQSFANHQAVHIDEETSDNADGQETVEEGKPPHAGREGQKKENPYQCCTCGKTYVSQYNLNRHQRLHGNRRPYKCTVCGKTFTYRYTLAHHEATHTEGKARLQKCSYCGRKFTTEASLSKHLQLHMVGRPFHCDVCGKGFASRYTLAHHMEIHAEGQPQKCLFCYKVFRTSHSLKRHKRIHMETRSYQCSVCGKAFGTNYSLCRHQYMHLSGSLRRSSSGGKRLVDGSAPAKDQASDTDENSNNWSGSSTVSGHCGEETPAECSTSVDGSPPSKCRRVRVEEDPSEELDVKEFSKRVDGDILAKRQSAHLKERSRQGLDGGEAPRDHSVITKDEGSDAEGDVREGACRLVYPRQKGGCVEDSLPESSVKREGFRASVTMTKHQNTHTGVNSIPGFNGMDSSARSGLRCVARGQQEFVCSHCGKPCRDRYSLKRHERTHTTERPYECGKCEKTFREAKNLIRHQLTHSDHRPYQCSECGKRFKSKASLDKHQKVHEKPFSCPHCGKRVTTRTILMNHLRTHTGERPFKCTECGKDYKTKAAMKTHRERHFKEN